MKAMKKNWIDEYIRQIIYGTLPTIDENTGEIIMQTKIDGVWKNESYKKEQVADACCTT